jgi:hypothetical protein
MWSQCVVDGDAMNGGKGGGGATWSVALSGGWFCSGFCSRCAALRCTCVVVNHVVCECRSFGSRVWVLVKIVMGLEGRSVVWVWV